VRAPRPVDQVMVARFLAGKVGFSHLGRPERAEAIRELIRRKVPADLVQELYAIRRDAYERALATASTPNTRSLLDVKPPAGDVPCAGKPALFELDENNRPDPEALRLCAQCDVRDWCRTTVRPSTSGFTGVCAGQVWVNGKVSGKR